MFALRISINISLKVSFEILRQETLSPKQLSASNLVHQMRGFYDMRWDQSDLVSDRPDMGNFNGGVLVYEFVVVG